ncbi:unnamed protein product [Nesidiocoris tenuis]|uniref:Uncharacterized protein n=1 Tax=Nesidiocoris tenuis TaxID=355587 RepID=A0A6H5H5I5_9HEMI|nr:unnamed protein product [Nesidiocoris tenuis]
MDASDHRDASDTRPPSPGLIRTLLARPGIPRTQLSRPTIRSVQILGESLGEITNATIGKARDLELSYRMTIRLCPSNTSNRNIAGVRSGSPRTVLTNIKCLINLRRQLTKLHD